jgi:hypothetical protein
VDIVFPPLFFACVFSEHLRPGSLAALDVNQG